MIYGFIPTPGIVASGSGKTITMIKTLYEKFFIDDKKQNLQREVMSNMWIKDIEYTPIDVNSFLSNDADLSFFANKIIVLDELQEFVDSRASNSKQSLKIQKKIILQNRHQDTDILFSCQNIDMCDKRIRRSTHYLFFCEPLSYPNATHFRVSVYSNMLNKIVCVFEYDGRPYFNLYNTKELVQSS